MNSVESQRPLRLWSHRYGDNVSSSFSFPSPSSTAEIDSLGSLLVDNTLELRSQDSPDVKNLLRLLARRTSLVVRVVLSLANELIGGTFDEFLFGGSGKGREGGDESKSREGGRKGGGVELERFGKEVGRGREKELERVYEHEGTWHLRR